MTPMERAQVACGSIFPDGRNRACPRAGCPDCAVIEKTVREAIVDERARMLEIVGASDGLIAMVAAQERMALDPAPLAPEPGRLIRLLKVDE